MRPKVTALVSTYNGDRYLRNRLENLSLQEYDNLEVYVLDAASPGREADIVADFPAVRYERLDERIGLYAAWNRMIRASDAVYVATCNVDDVTHPEYFGRAVEMLESGYGLVYCHWYATKKVNQPWPPTEHDGVVAPEPDSTCGHFPIWRASLHDELGPFDEQFQVLGDADWWNRLRTARVPIGCISEPMGCYASRGQDNLYWAARDKNNRRACITEELLLRRKHNR